MIKLKYFSGLFLALLMFSNLISRVANRNLNALFYVVFIFILILSLGKFFHKQLNAWKLSYVCVLICFLLYIFDFRYSFTANLLSIKDFIVPMLSLIIGYYFAFNSVYVINVLNYLYLPFT